MMRTSPAHQTLTMRNPRLRFTIRTMMIAVLVVAVLLALPKGPGLIVLAVSLPCLVILGAQWLVLRGHRHIAAFGFWSLATLTNVSYAAFCVAPDIYVQLFLFIGWLIIVAPTLGALGPPGPDWRPGRCELRAAPHRPPGCR